ncbi:hypothetical protein BC835DRAFT_1292442, partial [Cytidiella melzeri]
PSNISFEQASTVPLAVATAAFGLYSKKAAPPGHGGAGLHPVWEEGGRGKYSGQPILVIGGSSAVGQQGRLDRNIIFLQLAKLSGFSPIITTASSHNASFVKSLGATHVIDRNTPLVSAVKAITSDPIKIVYDAISEKATQDEAYEVLAPGGSFILAVLPFAIEESKVDNTKEVVGVFGSVHDPRQLVQELDRVARERGSEGELWRFLLLCLGHFLIHICSSYSPTTSRSFRTASLVFRAPWRGSRPAKLARRSLWHSHGRSEEQAEILPCECFESGRLCGATGISFGIPT